MYEWGHILTNLTLQGSSGADIEYNFHISFNPGISNMQITARNQSEIVLGAVYVTDTTFHILYTNHSKATRTLYGVWWTCLGL